MNEPKKLYRVEQGRMLSGVCGGIAEYFNIDPTIVRLALVVLFFAYGLGFLAYLIATIVIPNKSTVYPGY